MAIDHNGSRMVSSGLDGFEAFLKTGLNFGQANAGWQTISNSLDGMRVLHFARNSYLRP